MKIFLTLTFTAFLFTMACQRQVTVTTSSSAAPFVASQGVCPTLPDTVTDASLKSIFRQGVLDRLPLPLPQITPSTVTFQNLPTWMSFDNVTGEVYGQAPDSPGTNSLTFTGKNTSGTNVTQTWTYQITSDPLFQYAWHLLNVGQNNFASQSTTPGVDTRAYQVFAMQGLGAGIKVAISDTGIQMAHEDLINNSLPSESRDYLASAPYAGCPPVTSEHATSVAGILAGSGWNGIGARGVAPLAKFASLNYVDSDQLIPMALDQLGGNFDIFNQSFGVYTDEEVVLDSSYREKLKYGISNLRNGRGAIYVKAAGNSFNACQNSLCSQNASADPYNANPFTIVVGSLTGNDTKSSYSTAGSTLWVSAYGGEYGDTNPAIMSTDLSGCSDGYAQSNSTANTFENSLTLNPNCNYTSRFNGTSAATPMVSGVVALVLEANPNLKWRDVRRVLASTARQVHTSFAPLTLPQTGITFEPGWLTNAAGYKFHNWYGFGAVNAKAAVDLAKTYSQYLPVAQELRTGDTWALNSGTVNLPVPDRSNTGVQSNLSVPNDWVIESVEVKVNINHAYPSEISIELESPSGTKNIILNPLNSFTKKANISNFIMVSNAFYGESSMGIWRITVRDALADDAGQLVDWSLNIVGHPK